MQCTACLKPLSGGTDTFGDIHQPMCQHCFLTLSRPEKTRIIHRIELDENGRIIFEGYSIQYVAVNIEQEMK